MINIKIVYTFNILVYIVLYAYIFIALINFFHPITIFFSTLIIFVSTILAVISSILIPFKTFLLTPYVKKNPKILTYILLLLLFIWVFIVAQRPTIDTDANVYHLPLSLLMNNSVWYPGIGNLSTVYPFPNGNSALASIFTSFGTVGFENIPNLLIWVMLGIGIFIYLAKQEISLSASFIITLLFLFTPSIFWQSYNMGTDLPFTAFLTFGLLALSDKKFEDSILFLALSSVFKTLGIAALFFTVLYILILKILKKGKINFLDPRVLLSSLLIVVFLTRIFIASGNPIYPLFCLKLAPWGINSQFQKALIERLKAYSGAQRTIVGFFIFIKSILFYPQRFRSSYWFWPFLMGCLLAFLYLFIKNKYLRKVNFNLIFIFFLIISLLGIWFRGSPVFRFIAGILIFITLKLFILIYKFKLPGFYKLIIYASLFITLSLFVFNVIKHIKKDVLPLVFASEETIQRLLPYDKKMITTITTEDGFTYSKSSKSYCGRSTPPCLHSCTLGNEIDLIENFKKYNKRFLFNKK